jgi:hypothetical protein
MNLMLEFLSQSKKNWLNALRLPYFRSLLIPGCILVAAILAAMPFFFQAIERRNGSMLNDWILDQMPSFNVSVAIFIIIWTMGLLSVFRAVRDPYIFIVFCWSYIFVSIFRAATISLIPLNPPTGLVELIDPISNTFYGHALVTKDLFFSGHTSTIFLMYLCMKKKGDKVLILAATFMLVFLLMIQHIHYVIDIVAAPLFTYISYLGGRWLVFGRTKKGEKLLKNDLNLF